MTPEQAKYLIDYFEMESEFDKLGDVIKKAHPQLHQAYLSLLMLSKTKGQ